jgi:hypothetical protein
MKTSTEMLLREGRIGIVLVGLLVFAAVALPAMAQVAGGFDLSWNTFDGGGGTFSTGGAYSLGGTVGQADAGAQAGGAFNLAGGFWGAGDPTATPTPTSTPVPALILVGHVDWQGRPAQPNGLQQLPVTLTVKSALAELNYVGMTTNASGYFTVTLGALAPGTYNWRVKGPKYLATAGSVALTGAGAASVEMGTQRVGDCNNDNRVDAVDFIIIKTSFGKASGDPGYDDRADLNGDVRVTAVDFNLMKSNFGFAGSGPLGPVNPQE